MASREEGGNGSKVSNFICNVSSPESNGTKDQMAIHPCGQTFKSSPQAEAVVLLVECLPTMLSGLDPTPSFLT